MDDPNGANNLTLTGTISGPGGLTQNSSGTLILSGPNTYTGGTNLSNGTVGAGNNAAFGTGGITVSGDTSLYAADTDQTLNNNISINSGETLTIVDDPNGPNVLTLSGTISGPGGLTFFATDSIISGPNTYTGTTAVGAESILELFNSDALQDSTLSIESMISGFRGNPKISGHVVFDSSVTSNTFNIGGLAGSGDLALENDAATPAAITLNVGGDNADTTYSGNLSGPGSLIKVGSGTLILSGDNSYMGGTTFDGGAVGAEMAPPLEPVASPFPAVRPSLPPTRIRPWPTTSRSIAGKR